MSLEESEGACSLMALPMQQEFGKGAWSRCLFGSPVTIFWVQRLLALFMGS